MSFIHVNRRFLFPFRLSLTLLLLPLSSFRLFLSSFLFRFLPTALLVDFSLEPLLAAAVLLKARATDEGRPGSQLVPPFWCTAVVATQPPPPLLLLLYHSIDSDPLTGLYLGRDDFFFFRLKKQQHLQ